MPIKTSNGKWKWGNVERSSKKELVQTVYGIWKKNGSKGSFSDFLKGTHESIVSEDTKRYAYHCTNIDPEIIKKEGWKVGDGFTLDNQFKDLYKKYLPNVPVFVSRLDVPVWDSKAKYCIKLDITGLELFPDFGYLPDFGAYYDYDEECFYWENEDDLDSNKKLKDFVLDNCDNLTLYADCFDGEDSFDVLGTACVDGSKLKDRIVEWKSTTKESLVKEYWDKRTRYMYCADCHTNLSKAPDDQYIMISDKLWSYVCKHGGKEIEEEDHLCRDCIEKRLGRKLTLKDLGDKINLPINDEIKKILNKRKNKMTNEAREIHLHSYPEELQPMIERIVKGNEDYELDHAYFNKEGKFIWFRNLKGYFHVFKLVKFVTTPGMMKPFGLKDLILKDNGMLEEVNRYRFENGQEAMKFLQQRYKFDKNSIS